MEIAKIRGPPCLMNVSLHTPLYMVQVNQPGGGQCPCVQGPYRTDFAIPSSCQHRHTHTTGTHTHKHMYTMHVKYIYVCMHTKRAHRNTCINMHTWGHRAQYHAAQSSQDFCGKNHVYQLPWGYRGGRSSGICSPVSGCRNLLSPQPSFCQSPSVKE